MYYSNEREIRMKSARGSESKISEIQRERERVREREK